MKNKYKPIYQVMGIKRFLQQYWYQLYRNDTVFPESQYIIPVNKKGNNYRGNNSSKSIPDLNLYVYKYTYLLYIYDYICDIYVNT